MLFYIKHFCHITFEKRVDLKIFLFFKFHITKKRLEFKMILVFLTFILYTLYAPDVRGLGEGKLFFDLSMK